MQVLKKAQVLKDILVETLVAVTIVVFIEPTSFFTDLELAPPEGRTLPLSATVKINNYKLSSVLVDTGV